MYYLIKIKSIYGLALFNLMISPVLPKIKFSEGVYAYFHEILLIAILPMSLKFLFRFKMQHKHQSFLFFAWLFILLANIVSGTFNAKSYLYVLKYIAYSSVFFIAYTLFDLRKIKLMLYVSVIAMTMNLINFMSNGFNYGFSIWEMRTISSGFSNSFFDPMTISFGKINAGSHSIWGAYCLIALVLSAFMYKEKFMSAKLFFYVSLLSIISIFTTVSREAFVLLIICFPFFFNCLNGRGSYSFDSRFIFVFLAIISLFIFSLLIVDFPIFDKLIYTLESFKNNGRETNLEMRYNIHLLILGNIVLDPLASFFGYGFKSDAYLEMLKQSSSFYGIVNYPNVPESAYLQFFAYGGFLSFVFFTLFSFYILRYLIGNYSNRLSRALLFITIGNILSSIFVSGTWVSDFYLGTYLVVLGFTFKYVDMRKYEQKNIDDKC